MRDWPTMLLAGTAFTFIFALPGFLIAVGLSLRRRWHRWAPFAVAGAADAFFALGLLGAYNGDIYGTMSVGLVVACLPGGFAGGAAYFAAAGRFLAGKR